MPNLKTLRTITKKFSRKQNNPIAEFGILGNGQGLVEVPNEPNLSYVQIGSRVEKIHNVRVPNNYGVMVSIGYDPMDPQKRQVLSVSTQQTENAGILSTRTGYPPASRYRWMATDGGQDPLYVELRASLPLRVSPAGGLYISIYTGIVHINSAHILRAFEVIDLSAYVPVNASKALLALIAINTSNAAVVTVGDEVDIADLADDLSDQPAMPTGTLHALALVRLYYGQIVIREDRTNTDIYDLRMPYLANLTNDLVGLGNVTNDAQVKAEANSFNGFTEKVAPVAGDRLLLEDSEDDFEKKFVEIGNLPGGGEGTLAVSDGTTSVNNVATLDIIGGVVSGATGEATVTISTTSIGLGNVTNDAQLKRSGNDWSSFAELTSLADDDKLLAEDYSDGGTKKFIKKSNLPTGGGTAALYACVADVKASGTHGGTFTSGSLQTRTLNTILQDANGIVSLASNQFTLQAGNYAIHATVPAIRVNQHNAVLYNVTDSEITVLGNSASSTNTSSVGGISSSIIIGEFTIEVETIFEIRHQCTTSVSTYGYGLGHDFGRNNIYTIVEIWKK